MEKIFGPGASPGGGPGGNFGASPGGGAASVHNETAWTEVNDISQTLSWVRVGTSSVPLAATGMNNSHSVQVTDNSSKTFNITGQNAQAIAQAVEARLSQPLHAPAWTIAQ